MEKVPGLNCAGVDSAFRKLKKCEENQIVLERRYCRGRFVKISGQWDECLVIDSRRVCWTIVGIKLLKSKKGRRLEVKWRAWFLSKTGYLDTGYSYSKGGP